MKYKYIVPILSTKDGKVGISEDEAIELSEKYSWLTVTNYPSKN
jgi:hypothetical protein